MNRLAVGALGAALAWTAAPWVAMGVRGTIDQRTRAAWRREPREGEPSGPGPFPAAWATIPAGRADAAAATTRT